MDCARARHLFRDFESLAKSWCRDKAPVLVFQHLQVFSIKLGLVCEDRATATLGYGFRWVILPLLIGVLKHLFLVRWEISHIAVLGGTQRLQQTVWLAAHWKHVLRGLIRYVDGLVRVAIVGLVAILNFQWLQELIVESPDLFVWTIWCLWGGPGRATNLPAFLELQTDFFDGRSARLFGWHATSFDLPLVFKYLIESVSHWIYWLFTNSGDWFKIHIAFNTLLGVFWSYQLFCRVIDRLPLARVPILNRPQSDDMLVSSNPCVAGGLLLFALILDLDHTHVGVKWDALGTFHYSAFLVVAAILRLIGDVHVSFYERIDALG